MNKRLSEHKTLILFIFMLFVFMNFKKSVKKKENEKDFYSSSISNIKNFELKGYEKSKLIWELFGKTAVMNFHNDKNKAKITFPLLYFYDKNSNNNTIETEMSSDHAIIDIKTNDVSAFGKVILKSYKEKSILYTDSIFYNKKDNIFFSDSFFRLEQLENVTEGIGFTSKIDLSEITIKDDVNIKYISKSKNIR